MELDLVAPQGVALPVRPDSASDLPVEAQVPPSQPAPEEDAVNAQDSAEPSGDQPETPETSVPQPEVAADPFAAVPSPLRAALAAKGFGGLTAVQSAVLAAEGGGRDLQISSQTGSGKTVALGFVLARMLESCEASGGPDALIIVPTRELATQVCEELGWLFKDLQGVRVVSVTGGTPLHRDRHALARRPRVLVGTPGRLLDHVTNGAIDLSGVRELVLDEADQMLDMGFREELEGILDMTPDTRHTHMVSATFPDGIQRLAKRYQREPLAIEGTRLGDANQDIEHQAHLVHGRDRYALLTNLLLLADGERALVFVTQRAEAQELAERLEGDGFAALPLSGELAQSQRARTLAAFRSGRASVLVATDVAARGLDVPDVMTVIHTAPPMDSQVYTHRSGRTGRAGKRGRSILMTPPKLQRRVGRLAREAGIELSFEPVPSAADVRNQLEERARASRASELKAALAEGPTPSLWAEAEALLEGQDATAVVASLLGLRKGPERAKPREVENLRREPEQRPHFDRGGNGQGNFRQNDRYGRQERPGRFGGNERPGRFGGGERPFRNDRRPQSGHPARGGRREDGEMIRFFMNWGMNQGASPGRVLAAVCRRGEVDGQDIGGIAVHPNASTFDVRADVAERFERLASRRDPRDKQTRIRRDRGPRPDARDRRN